MYEDPDSDRQYWGLIEIIRATRHSEISQELPSDYSQRPQVGAYIDCIVCYYREEGRQISLNWLGNIKE